MVRRAYTPEQIINKLRELQAEIDEVKKMLVHMPATTIEEQLQRAKPEIQLGILNAQKELFLETPKEQVAKELALKACRLYCKHRIIA